MIETAQSISNYIYIYIYDCFSNLKVTHELHALKEIGVSKSNIGKRKWAMPNFRKRKEKYFFRYMMEIQLLNSWHLLHFSIRFVLHKNIKNVLLYIYLFFCIVKYNNLILKLINIRDWIIFIWGLLKSWFLN